MNSDTNILFSAEDEIFPLPLYHGTDKRLIEMGIDAVIFLRDQCKRLVPVILDCFKSELSINDLDNVFEIIRAERAMPEEERRIVEDMYLGSIHHLIQYAKGNEKFQYGAIYLTSSLSEAERYADFFSYCGGELCDLVYRSVVAIEKLWPKIFSPDPDMRKAIDVMKNLAAGDKHPIVYKFSEVRCDYLLTETGEPLSTIFGELSSSDSFRYSGPVNFDELEIQYEKIETPK